MENVTAVRRVPPYRPRPAWYWLAFVAALVSATPARAQQAIISLPSADQTPAGKHFFMHETQMSALAPRVDWGATHFYTYGLSDRVELAVTLYNLTTPTTNNLSLGVGFKAAQRLFGAQFPDRELQFTYGAMLVPSLQGEGIGSWSYGLLSARVPRADTRLSVGGGYGSRQIFDKAAASAMLGLEQPLPGHFVLVAEWFSGRHNTSNFIAGLLYHTDAWIFVGGYKMPNDAAKRRGIVFEIGRFF